MDRLDGMRSFVAVAQEGSFTAAAQRLGLSTRLVSKYVAQLEERLSTQLFNRTTRSVALTEVGRSYLEHCRPLLDQFDELEELVQERQSALAGTVHITAPTGFGSTHLATALAPFMAANPNVSIDLRLTDSRVSLVEEGVDLAIRIGILRDSTLIARKLADMPMITCAAPSYLAEAGRPSDPRALATHTCIIDTNPAEPHLWRYIWDDAEVSVRVAGRFTGNAPAAAARMALAGIGIARCPLYTISEDLDTGRLVPVFPKADALGFGVYALYPPNRHLTRRVRALIDHLSTAF